ncbi:MAG: carbohydrate ABC transporter permease [Treponema sp.]|nr:carbohydrate ABC transporter permease [Treponema sp.]
MKKDNAAKSIMILFLVLFVIYDMIPILMMFMNSFKTGSELSSNSWGLPKNIVIENYKRLITYSGGVIARSYFNAIFIAVSYTVLTIILSSLAAFAFSKFKFRGRKIMFAFLLATMMIPMEITIPPLYIIFSKIKWLNTYYVQIFPGIASVFCMFMMKQYMDGLPSSLIESARLDGANHLTVFTRIMFPISAPAVGALTILTFLGKWNDFIWPQTMVSDMKYLPIMVILPTLNDKDSVWSIPWELLMAGCTMVVIPIIIVFFAFQKYFMSSVVIGAVKE